jgi:hypothetical protein
VGRRDEMAALEGEFARAAAGEFRVVLLLGEAGVGKSRLGRELLARHSEAVGMFARAHPLGVTAAFGLWAEAIDPLLQGRSDRQIAAVCGGLLDDLASLFHRVAAVRGSLSGREPPLPRLLQGLAALVRNLAAEAPVLAVLDDVHFADASSWEALRYFARHLDDTRLLVVATSRPADLAEHEAAAQALFELDEDGFLSRLGVARWTGRQRGSWPRRSSGSHRLPRWSTGSGSARGAIRCTSSACCARCLRNVRTCQRRASGGFRRG